jgi:hypothetical protein
MRGTVGCRELAANWALVTTTKIEPVNDPNADTPEERSVLSVMWFLAALASMGTASTSVAAPPPLGFVEPDSVRSVSESTATRGRAPGAQVYDPDDDAIWVCVDDAGHKTFVTKGFSGCRRLDGLVTPNSGRSPEANARREATQGARADARLKGFVDPDAPQAQPNSKIDPKFDELFDQKAEQQKPLPGYVSPWAEPKQPGAVFRSDGAVLTMPPGWIQIPAPQVQRVREEMQRQAPAAKMPAFDYAYQEGSAEWSNYPYVLIAINRKGRIPEGELESMGATNAASAVDTEGLSSIVTGASARQMLYDRVAKVVWLNTEASLVDNQKIRGITAMIPTEFGVVRVSGYAREADFAGFAGSFERMIREASIDESVRYKPHASDSLPRWLRDLATPEVLKNAVIGAILGLAGAGVALRKRKLASSGANNQKVGP